MNRNHFFVFVFALYSFSLWAEETLIVLTHYGNRGEKGRTEMVFAGADFLMVNGEKLAPAQIISQSGPIRKISEFKSPIKTNKIKSCYAGHFEHILKKGNLVRSETGCLESDRYQELKASFTALAKDSFLDSK